MIIWRGRGIIILLFGFVGAIAGGVAARKLGGPTLPKQWDVVASIWGATAGAWLFALTLGKTQEKILLDPKTQQPVRLQTSHSLYGIGGVGWGWLGVVAAVVVTVLAFVSPSSLTGRQYDTGPLPPPKRHNTNNTNPASTTTKPSTPKPPVIADSPAPAQPAPAPAVSTNEASSSPLPTPILEWKDSAGRPMKASLQRFTTPNYDTAEFKREDGQLFEVPLIRFSAEDRAKIAEIATQVIAEQEKARKAK